MDPEITITVDAITFLKWLLLLFFVSLLITVVVVRRLFYSNFKHYQKWLGKEVNDVYTNDMDELRKHYSEAMALEEEKVEANTEQLRLETEKIALLALRVTVMECLFDRLMGGVLLINSANNIARKAVAKVSPWTKFSTWTNWL